MYTISTGVTLESHKTGGILDTFYLILLDPPCRKKTIFFKYYKIFHLFHVSSFQVFV